MRIYGRVWRATASCVALVGFTGGVVAFGWAAMSAAIVGLSVVAGLMALVWVRDPRDRLRSFPRFAWWSAAGGALVLGLPALIGGWTLLAALLVAGTSPALVGRVHSQCRRRRPLRAETHARRMADQDLIQRWRRTAAELRHPSTSPPRALSLVQEREMLLDEVERRDPAGFDDGLVRAGWRSADAAVE